LVWIISSSSSDVIGRPAIARSISSLFRMPRGPSFPPFSFLQPHPSAPAILRDEFDPALLWGCNKLFRRVRSTADVPMIYDNKRRAILAIEKGPSGEQAFEAGPLILGPNAVGSPAQASGAIRALAASRSVALHPASIPVRRDRPQCNTAHQADLAHVPSVRERFCNECELAPA